MDVSRGTLRGSLRRCFAILAISWLMLVTVSLPAAESPLSLARFSLDITPPIGPDVCSSDVTFVRSVEHPLLLSGVVLATPTDRFVLAAIDACGLCGESYDRIRRSLGAATGVSAERVALHSLHQHTAPILDLALVRLLSSADSAHYRAHLAYHQQIEATIARELPVAIQQLTAVTDIFCTQAKVDRVASNRRIPQPDGSIAVRASYTADETVRNAPEGLIDPWLRTVTFCAAEGPIAELHFYATHPQTFYGDGRISWDIPGLARQRVAEATGLQPIYLTGCGGNVTVGKYNPRKNAADRAELATRLGDAMLAAATRNRLAWTAAVENATPPARSSADSSAVVANESVLRIRLDQLSAADCSWQTRSIPFARRREPEWGIDVMTDRLATPGVSHGELVKAAAYLAWIEWLDSGHAAELTSLRIGPLSLIGLPGEPLVEFQLAAQLMARPGAFVCVAGYGDCGPWYYGPDQIYRDRGGYEQTWSLTAPVETDVLARLAEIMEAQPGSVESAP